MDMQPAIDSRSSQRAGRAQLVVRASLVESQRRLHGVVFRQLRGNRSATEDILQEFALRALLRAGDLRELDKVNGWLSSVLRSVLGDYWRHAARLREDFKDAQEMAEFPAAPKIEPVVHAEINLIDLLAGLRSDQGDLLRRVELDGETHEHAAMRLGILPNALDVRLHRARRALQSAGRMAGAAETPL